MCYTYIWSYDTLPVLTLIALLTLTAVLTLMAGMCLMSYTHIGSCMILCCTLMVGLTLTITITITRTLRERDGLSAKLTFDTHLTAT